MTSATAQQQQYYEDEDFQDFNNADNKDDYDQPNDEGFLEEKRPPAPR